MGGGKKKKDASSLWPKPIHTKNYYIEEHNVVDVLFCVCVCKA